MSPDGVRPGGASPDGVNPDVIVGPVRRGRNLSIDAVGSIHDDSTAQSLGFRGGTVAGDIHLDQFAPLLLEAFGNQWFETGSLSMQFKTPTTDGEPVVAVVERPTRQHDVQVRAWMETPDGTIVCQGTASVGTPPEPSALHSVDFRAVDPSQLVLLKTVVIGQDLETAPAQPRGADQQRRLDAGIVTEPLDCYSNTSPWGGPIASPLTTAQLLHTEPVRALQSTLPPFVGLYGAVEIRYVHGPILLGETYAVGGKLVAVSDSPKTEILWYDTEAIDSQGRVVATCRMMTRLLKNSAPSN
jgi:hypothetical protein